MKLLVAITFYLLAQLSSGQQGRATGAASAPPQANPAVILLPELRVEGVPVEVFTRVLKAAGMPGGVVVEDPACSYGPKVSFLIQAGTTLGQALDKIATATSSSWQIDHGAVNIFPASGTPPLLDLRIESFEWDKSMSARETVGRLAIMPEVLQRIHELGLRQGRAEGGATAVCIIGDCAPKPKPTPALETERDTPLLSILNRVAVAHGQAVWTYMEFHCENQTNYALYAYAE